MQRRESAGRAREDRRFGLDSGSALVRREVSNASMRNSLPHQLMKMKDARSHIQTNDSRAGGLGRVDCNSWRLVMAAGSESAVARLDAA